MRKKKQLRRIARNLYLPSWLKLRINPDLKGQADWLIEQGELTGASSIALRLHLKHRPWNVILTVKRRYNDHGHQAR